MVDETWLENELRLLDRSPAENAPSELPVYQPEVACVASMSLNAFAHFSTQPNTICALPAIPNATGATVGHSWINVASFCASV